MDELTQMEEFIKKIMDIQVFDREIILYFEVRNAEEPLDVESFLKVENFLEDFEDAKGLMTEEGRHGPVNTVHPRDILVSVFELLPTSGTASGVLAEASAGRGNQLLNGRFQAPTGPQRDRLKVSGSHHGRSLYPSGTAIFVLVESSCAP